MSLVVNEPLGLREAVLAEMSRKQLRALRRELERQHGLRLFEIDWRYLDWIAIEGYERAKARGHLGESASSFPALRMQITGAAAAPRETPRPSGLPADSEALRSSEKLFEEPDLGHWLLPEVALGTHLERYRELRASPIVLDSISQQSRILEILDAALVALFSGEGGASWTRRLRELSYTLGAAGRKEAAGRAEAAAAALSASTSGGKEIPFFEELVRRSFGLVIAEEAQAEREAKAGSLLVTPDQIREEQARARAGRLR